MSAAATKTPAASSPRLLADVQAFDQRPDEKREPALSRLEEALGRDFADRLVAALSAQSKR
jgi:hypothetical protein